jgi:hypothetical protein
VAAVLALQAVNQSLRAELEQTRQQSSAARSRPKRR